METVTTETFGTPDRDGLSKFLSYCRERADEQGEPFLASITRRVMDLDPLAVLRAIYEEDQPHLYMEKRSVSISGAEAVARQQGIGGDRTEEVQNFIAEWLGRTISTGDTDTEFSGPLFFTAFAFDPEDQEAYTVFIPKWQVCRTDTECVAVANVRIEPGVDVGPEVARVWHAHQKFNSFGSSTSVVAPSVPLIRNSEAEPREAFIERVEKVLQAIKKGTVEKVVLARWQDLVADCNFDPLDVLHYLREIYSDCYAFSFSSGDGSSWIGATPERLLRCSGKRFETEAIAGSAPRGKNLVEDTSLGQELFASSKDLREHNFVVDSICRRLSSMGLAPEVAQHPQLLRLSNVQHLRTPIHGAMNKEHSLLTMANSLHPTPAVGGVPRQTALVLLKNLEPFSRGLYTGYIGWQKADFDGELVVALRTAHIEANRARLYAGAGIVEGSIPEREFLETEIKLKAMIAGLEHPATHRLVAP